jgi:hypothetical protein
MNKIVKLLCLLALVAATSCQRTVTAEEDQTQATTTRVLVTNPWKIDKITDANGTTIPLSSLPAESRALFGINIQFFEDKSVRAIDPVSRTVVNGGSWQFLDEEKTLDIDVSQLKGKFPILNLSRTRMVLRNRIQFNGLPFDVNLELVPSI